VQKVAFDFSSSGYALVIVDTGGDHADLTPDYAAVRGEMQAVAAALGGQVLRDVSEEQALANIPTLRAQAGDRAILRSFHFFEDDRRVVLQAEALEAGEFNRFLALVIESGRSSWMLLQNCYPPTTPASRGLRWRWRLANGSWPGAAAGGSTAAGSPGRSRPSCRASFCRFTWRRWGRSLGRAPATS